MSGGGPAPERVELKRTLSLPMLTLYGVGTLVGGGFYALIGKVAGLAGDHAAFALLMSAVLAVFSALTFCELSARFPYSGGPARYVQEVFGLRWLARLVGITVIATGVISAATLANAVAGFVAGVAPVPIPVGALVTVLALSLVAAWGIGESVVVAVAITLIEVGGLVYVAVVARDGFRNVAANPEQLVPPLEAEPMTGIVLAAFLAFYAFIGFEDLVTVAEEVKRPERTVPRAILLSVGITTVLYVVVALAAMGSVSTERLAAAGNPLVEVIRANGVEWVMPMVVVSVLAGINGALMQVVMGSRVLYGMASQGDAPGVFARVHPWTRTPLPATAVVGLATLALAWLLPLIALARATSLLLLAVFTVVNAALFVLKRGDPAPFSGTSYPIVVPFIGAILSATFVAVEIARLWG